MPDKSKLDWALEYAAKGWRVFPLFYVRKDGSCSCGQKGCKRVGKHPISKNGLLEATTDKETIKQWWKASVHANIGMATGHDGIVVMDVDTGFHKDGSEKVGPLSLENLQEAYSKLPSTFQIKTGSGGTHYWFHTIDEIKNSQSKIAPDIDVRGSGGYVILPPSNHESGGYYEFVNPDAGIADVPDWLAKKMGAAAKVDLSEHSLQDSVANEKEEKPKHATREQLVKVLEFIPADCDRDTWWRIGAALKSELGDKAGREVWEAWSKKAPTKYDEKTAQRHWDSFVPDKKISAGTIFHYAKEHGFRGFNEEAADSAELKDAWVYVTAVKRFVKVQTLTEWDREQFDANFAPLFSRIGPSTCVLRNPSFRKLDSATYWPNQEQIVIEEGVVKLNYWRASGVTPAPGPVKPFLEHVAYLYPNAEEARILLSYLAFQVQHPGEKVHWAVLMEGDQGNGKSYFATVMRLILGAKNVRVITSDNLHESFTGWQRNTQLIVVEEMMAKQRLELMNKLKPMITESWCSIREMYRPPYEQPNRFNFMFFSNHKDSIIIDDTDRRYCILSTKAKPHPESNGYYGPLFSWTRDHAPQLLNFLLNYDLTNFRPKAHAPMTAGKVELILSSMPSLVRHIYEAVQNGAWPFDEDLVELEHLIEPLAEVGLRPTTKEISKAFEQLKFSKLKRIRTGFAVPEKVSLWAIRNGEVYSSMTDDHLRQQWRRIYENKRLSPNSEECINGKNPGIATVDLSSCGELDPEVIRDSYSYSNRKLTPVMKRKPELENAVKRRKAM